MHTVRLPVERWIADLLGSCNSAHQSIVQLTADINHTLKYWSKSVHLQTEGQKQWIWMLLIWMQSHVIQGGFSKMKRLYGVVWFLLSIYFLWYLFLHSTTRLQLIFEGLLRASVTFTALNSRIKATNPYWRGNLKHAIQKSKRIFFFFYNS